MPATAAIATPAPNHPASPRTDDDLRRVVRHARALKAALDAYADRHPAGLCRCDRCRAAGPGVAGWLGALSYQAALAADLAANEIIDGY